MIAAAVKNEAEENPTTGRERCGWTGPVYDLLKKYKDLEWLKGWLLRGEDPPEHIVIATPSQIRYCRIAWDFTSHCDRAGLSVPNSSYCPWLKKRLIPDVRWLLWLYGYHKPETVYVLPDMLLRLRRERTVERIAAATGVSKRTLFTLWQRSPALNALNGIKAVVAEGRRRLDGPGSWEAVSAKTKDRMFAFAKAGMLAECCRRAEIGPANYYEQLASAERFGAKEDLERYLGIHAPLPDGAERYGLLTDKFFVPTSGMLRFRAAAMRARAQAGRPSSEPESLPEFTQWFLDWTTPPKWRRRRMSLPEVAPARGWRKRGAEQSQQSVGSVAMQQSVGETARQDRDREVRKRRARDKHLEWKRMHDEEGKSARLIAYIWTEEKGEETTEDAVKKALKRLRQEGGQ
jgi:hypothetical protein